MISPFDRSRRWGLRLAAIVFATLLAPAAAFAAYTTGTATLRAGPGTKFARIATLPAGVHVGLGRCQGSWCRVVYRGQAGWMASSLIRGVAAHRPVVVRPIIVHRPIVRPRPPHWRPRPPHHRPPRAHCKIAPGFSCR